MSLTRQRRSLERLELKEAQAVVKRKGRTTHYECAIPFTVMPAIQSVIGNDIPLFGAYCAGEIGPVDVAGKDTTVSSGVGWHVMFTVLGR